MIRTSARWTLSRSPGAKYCTSCKEFCQSAGGMQIISADKLRQRWVCGNCKDRHGRTFKI